MTIGALTHSHTHIHALTYTDSWVFSVLFHSPSRAVSCVVSVNQYLSPSTALYYTYRDGPFSLSLSASLVSKQLEIERASTLFEREKNDDFFDHHQHHRRFFFFFNRQHRRFS